MNIHYRYEKQHLWYDDAWQGKEGAVDPLFQWLGKNDSVSEAPAYARPEADPRTLPYYHAKTNSVNLPEVISYWQAKGVRYTSLEQGCKHWISMMPEGGARGGRKLRALVVLHQQDCADPWWAMDTMAKHVAYNEMAARRQDTVIIYLVSKGPDSDRIFGNILQEACALYPVDLTQVFLDVSLAVRKGVRLSDIPGFSWPDGETELFEGIPVLNISGRWGTKDSLARSLVMNQAMNEGMFDRQWLIHSKGGERMAEAIELEHRFQTVNDPGYREYWDAMGLRMDIRETAGHRWLIFAPKQQLESREKLPLVLAMQEVYRGNEHLAVTAASYFYEYTVLAAQGECALLFFVLEDPDSNDLLKDIFYEAAKQYPIDKSRVYVTGHSHDGWFARHFAYRHPEMIAALATMGNHVGLADSEVVGNPNMGVSDAEIQHMKQFDMPTININGGSEGFSRYPATQAGQIRWAKDWQRRLEASRCPVPEIGTILQARHGDDPAMRTIGVPGDRGLCFWFDGVSHSVVDVKNRDGKYHLRVASSENMPHTVTPCMIDLAWSYLRQFSRNLENGELIEQNEKDVQNDE